MSKLVKNVIVDGVGYGPAYGNVEPPADVAERITNPAAWDGDAPLAEPVAPVEQVEPEQADPPVNLDASPDDFDWLPPAEEVPGQRAVGDLEAIADDKPALIAFAEKHGIDVDGRLGASKLHDVIADQLA